MPAGEPLTLARIPALLAQNPYIRGAAVVDEEGLTLSARLPDGVSEPAVAALAARMFDQLRSAAAEIGSDFADQVLVNLGRWTVQITFEKPFFIVTFHDSPSFPPALSRRLRKVSRALVRQEFGE